MRKRPLLWICIGWIVFILFCRGAGIPLFGEPGFTDEEKTVFLTGETVRITGTVLEKQENEQSVRYVLENVLVTCRGRSTDLKRMLLSTEEERETVLPGFVLSAGGTLRPIEPAGNPGQFDPAAYYGCKKIYYRMWTEAVDCTATRTTVRGKLYAWKEAVRRFFSAHMRKSSAGILSAMLLGDKAFLTEESRLNFQVGGCLHMLVISGLHVSLLGSALLRGLQRLHLPRFAAAFLAASGMVTYTVLTGWSVAAVRACLMFLLVLLSGVLKRTYDPPSALAGSAFLILLRDPGYLFYAGFQLSYAAAIGAALLGPFLLRLFPAPSAFRPKALWESTLSWTAIQLCTLPLLAYYFYELPLFSLPLNLLLVPLVQYILIAGVAGAACGLLAPPAGALLLLPLDLGLAAMDALLAFVRALPGSTWICGQPQIGQVAAYYGFLCIAGFLLYRQGAGIRGRRYAALPRTVKRRNRLLIGAGIVLLLVRPAPVFSLTMLDVGQGDCLVIRTKNTVILSDGGSTNVPEVGKNRILPYLKSQRIAAIDVLISHNDGDHYYGIEELLDMILERRTAIRIRSMGMPDWMAQTEDGMRLMEKCQKTGTAVRLLTAGDHLNAGAVQMQVLHPFPKEDNGREQTGREAGAMWPTEQEVPEEPAREGNAGSLVLLLQAQGFQALLTGDLEGKGEEELLPFLGRVDCLKVAHHGSRSSTSEAFLSITQPAIALISAPAKSLYGHPHPETLERLENSGAQILQTRTGGATELRLRQGKIRCSQYICVSEDDSVY